MIFDAQNAEIPRFFSIAALAIGLKKKNIFIELGPKHAKP